MTLTPKPYLNSISIHNPYLLRLRAPLSLLLHRFPLHATIEAFLVTTVLTSIPLLLVDDTILILSTRIRQILSHSSLEEAFAALTAKKSQKRTIFN
jgi:hypothetical protein